MDQEWSVIEETPITVVPRLLKMQASQAIRNLPDALVELITNCDDAYRNLPDDQGKIIIEVARRRGDTSGRFVVKDKAGGMTVAEMKDKILKYGGFSASEESRGFMGRGAKDVVALGPAVFESIKNGYVHHVEITAEFGTKIMKPIKASAEHYKYFGLKPGRGGLRVTVEVTKNHKVPQHETLCRELQRHYALRDIVRRREIRCVDANSGQENALVYTPPEGQQVADEICNFQSPYHDAVAHLQIFEAPGELSSDLQEGIIVCDEFAVHQVTRFAPDLDQDPIGRRFFGRLDCSHIRKLQLEHEGFRERKELPPASNPIDIVDLQRRRGCIQEHPFIRQLFDWAEGVLRKQVERVKSELGEHKKEIANDETKKQLQELSKAVAQHLKERADEETLTPRTKEEEAILAREGVLLNPQFSRIEVREIKRMGYTVLSFGESEDPKNVTIEVDSNALKASPLNPPLRQQRRNPDRLTAYFEIEGVEPTEKVTLAVRNKHQLIAPVFRNLEVIEPKDRYANLPYTAFFENQHYTVHDNGIRTLVFLAKGKRFRSVDWDSMSMVTSDNETAIAIMHGRKLGVERVDKDIFRGEVHVRGRGIGKHSTIVLSIPTKDGPVVASTVVEVADKAQPSVSIEIRIVPESGGQWRAQWDRENVNRLKVFALHPTLQRYLGRVEEKFPGQRQPHFKVLLAEIVADKVVQRILEQKMERDPNLFQNPQNIFFLYNEEMTAFLPKAHKIMLADTDAKKLLERQSSGIGHETFGIPTA